MVTRDTAAVLVGLIRGEGRGCSDIQQLLLVTSALCHVATCQVQVDGAWWGILRGDALEVGKGEAATGGCRLRAQAWA